jgi:two-component system chemotaxis response regulator CheY
MPVSNLSIVVVEDVQAMRLHLRQILQDLGFVKVQTAASVEEAQIILMVEPVDVVICDWYLNPSSGLDLLKDIRQKPDLKGTAFMMLTAENTKEKVIEALKSGVDDYMVKPISAAGLVDKINAAAAKRKK